MLPRLAVRAAAAAVLLIALNGLLSQVTAQTGAGCPVLVDLALSQIGANCDRLDRNTACYGFNRVEARFSSSVPEGFFTRLSDRAPLATMQSIRTAPLDLGLGQWGIAVLNVQANVPNTLPGQAVAFILLGDVEVTDAVPPQDVFQPAAEPVSVRTLVAANLRSAPTTNANVLTSVPAGTELLADALSADRQWLRIVYQNAVGGWVFREVLAPTTAADGLPVATPASRTPMQAFYFRTGLGDPACNEAPSLLVVQGPQQYAVNITANGVDIRIGSTVALRTAAGSSMDILVVDGSARVGSLIIPAGFAVTAPLTPDGRQPGGPLVDFRPMTAFDLDVLQTLQNLPPSILNYPIRVPMPAEIQQTLAALSGANRPGGPRGTATGPAAGRVNCAPFRLTSPLDGWATKDVTFFWDAAPGATSYRINLSTGFSAETTATNITLNLFQVDALTLSWSVDALFNGQVACTAGPLTLPRDLSIPGPSKPLSPSGGGP